MTLHDLSTYEPGVESVVLETHPKPAAPVYPRLGGTPFAVIDLETTGFAGHLDDRVIELAVIHTDPHGRITNRWTTLVNPGGGIDAADRWLDTDAAHVEPELILVHGADGHISIARAARMTESLLLTPSSRRFTAVPLITLGRYGRAWPREIAELENLINESSVRERDLQRFFEQNLHFLAGVDYDRVVPHPMLVRDDDGPLVPDFMLEVTGGAADIPI